MTKRETIGKVERLEGRTMLSDAASGVTSDIDASQPADVAMQQTKPPPDYNTDSFSSGDWGPPKPSPIYPGCEDYTLSEPVPEPPHRTLDGVLDDLFGSQPVPDTIQPTPVQPTQPY